MMMQMVMIRRMPTHVSTPHKHKTAVMEAVLRTTSITPCVMEAVLRTTSITHGVMEAVFRTTSITVVFLILPSFGDHDADGGGYEEDRRRRGGG